MYHVQVRCYETMDRICSELNTHNAERDIIVLDVHEYSDHDNFNILESEV